VITSAHPEVSAERKLYEAARVHHFIGGAAAWPVGVRAQTSGRVYQVGFLGVTSPAELAEPLEALRAGLRQFGYEEGKNTAIHFRWAESKYDRLPELAAELVRLNIDVLVVYSTPGARAAKQATNTVPVNGGGR
jgi:putative ABC transport system substrate-binding protein